jgi:hypothetical protein
LKFAEIKTRLTGISMQWLGVSWQPSEPEITAARRVIAYLEDRRVLYAPDQLEVAEHCVDSVLDIRRFLTGELGRLDKQSEFAASLRAVCAACRKFLDKLNLRDGDMIGFATNRRHWASWSFYSALGELRGAFGIHLARIAAQFELDVEADLASILPEKDTN